MTKAENIYAKMKVDWGRKNTVEKYQNWGKIEEHLIAKKNSVSRFVNKPDTVRGVDIPLIREFVVTTASLHDSQVDLSISGIPFCREKELFVIDPKRTSDIMGLYEFGQYKRSEIRGGFKRRYLINALRK